MGVSQNQRLRKAAAKAAKRKAVVAEKLGAQRRELAISKPRHVDLAASPIVACTISQDFKTRGAGTLLVVRQLTLGRYGVGFFHIDMWCVGIEDAYFEVLEAEDYAAYQEHAQNEGAVSPIEPALARKLVRDAAAYGSKNGFLPPDDFAEMESLFGDVAPAEATFTFGVNGKPYFVVDANDPPARVRRTLEHLERTLGPDGFEFEYPLEEDNASEGQAPERRPRASASTGADEPVLQPSSRPTARRAIGTGFSRSR